MIGKMMMQRRSGIKKYTNSKEVLSMLEDALTRGNGRIWYTLGSGFLGPCQGWPVRVARTVTQTTARLLAVALTKTLPISRKNEFTTSALLGWYFTYSLLTLLCPVKRALAGRIPLCFPCWVFSLI